MTTLKPEPRWARAGLLALRRSDLGTMVATAPALEGHGTGQKDGSRRRQQDGDGDLGGLCP